MRNRCFRFIAIACCTVLLCSNGPLAAQERGDGGGRRTWRFQRNLENTRNATPTKTALKSATSRAAAATVRVLCDGKPAALGTIVSADGLIATKASLIKGRITCRLADGRLLEAKMIGQDEPFDLALLRIEAKNLKAIEWHDGDVPLPGTIVSAPSPADGPLAMGVISDKPQEIAGPGGRSARQGWLGVTLEADDDGVEVQSVAPESAAAKAGIQAGDRIKRIDGADVQSVEHFIGILGRLTPGRDIKLAIQRGDETLQISATLERLPTTRTPGARLPQDMWGGGPFSDKRWGFPLIIPHDLVIQPGDCGGPLVDIDGKAIGINIARALRVASYAIPAAEVRRLVENLSKPARPTTQPS